MLEKNLAKQLSTTIKLTDEQLKTIEERIDYLTDEDFDCECDINDEAVFDDYKWEPVETSDYEGNMINTFGLTDEARAELEFLSAIIEAQEKKETMTFTGIFSTGDAELDKFLESIK